VHRLCENNNNKSQRDELFLKFIFGKELYMFRTDLLSIIAVGICHASYVDCLLARPGWTPVMDSRSVRNVYSSLSKINLRNSASPWLLL
jgi:hypothetical protein